jgi:HPt (histidine-containing phosphotransfer) domain-containing protein
MTATMAIIITLSLILSFTCNSSLFSLVKNKPLYHNKLSVHFCQLVQAISQLIRTLKGGNMAIGIPEIDEGSFNDLYDGDEELYGSVLSSFISKTPSVLSKLSTFSNETLAAYADTVHALKGACANICAEEARKMALDLELKAKAGDLAYCQSKNGAFLKYVGDLMPKLQDWSAKHQ